MDETRNQDNIGASVTIELAELGTPMVQSLIAALNAELSLVYPEEGATHFSLAAQEVQADRGAFLVASRGAAAIGCAAVRRIEPSVGEIKRMYVVPDERGSGVGRMLLKEVEAQARRLGLNRLVLETGIRQNAAIALYHSVGFTDIEPFGEYVDSPLSLCMAKNL